MMIVDEQPPIHTRTADSQTSGHNARLIRVLIVDDHKLIREGLRSIASSFKELEVVGDADSGERAVQLTRELKPDVVLMDIGMPGMSGIEATRYIKSEFPQIAVVGLSVHEEMEVVQEMAAAGIEGYLAKENAADHLYQAIQSAVRTLR
ncbi:hypothetical protein W02_10830 [Nitrospira sp. KM1]|uniref:response regulator n=1 Tax=Nitrospira sp. KM1 TaxID=1936990 RepID=UPI0013A7A100|nr:response regulator transcription factor [Nitrospira sp. KM1]BCA53943.1 hypothetical protein W02_10830 [Nitrospira sp. KM1]